MTWGDVSYEEFSTLVGTWGNSTGLVKGGPGKAGGGQQGLHWEGNLPVRRHHFRSNQTLRFPIRNWISMNFMGCNVSLIWTYSQNFVFALFCFAFFVTTNFPHQFLYLAQPMVYHWYFSLLLFLPRFLAGWTWAITARRRLLRRPRPKWHTGCGSGADALQH